MALHRVAQRALPLVVVGAGLPQIIALAGRSKSYSERLFDYPAVGPLAPPDATNALQAPVLKQGVRFADDAINEVLKVTEGYPYFLQQWGYEAWDIAAGPTITLQDVQEATVRSVKELDQSFFRVRFDRLTPVRRTTCGRSPNSAAGHSAQATSPSYLGLRSKPSRHYEMD